MIEDVAGDIFAMGSGVLIHQANCHHTMQSGIARDIRERYPEAYAADLATPVSDYAKLGTFSAARVAGHRGPDWIANLYSQFGYRDGDRKTTYDAMFAGLIRIRDDARFVGLDFAVPYRIGCGLAGGNWTVVRAILYAVFTEPFFPGAPQPRLRVFARSDTSPTVA